MASTGHLPAFPGGNEPYDGLTKLEWFAGQAMAGIATDKTLPRSIAVAMAIALALEMVEQLDAEREASAGEEELDLDELDEAMRLPV